MISFIKLLLLFIQGIFLEAIPTYCKREKYHIFSNIVLGAVAMLPIVIKMQVSGHRAEIFDYFFPVRFITYLVMVSASLIAFEFLVGNIYDLMRHARIRAIKRFSIHFFRIAKYLRRLEEGILSISVAVYLFMIGAQIIIFLFAAMFMNEHLLHNFHPTSIIVPLQVVFFASLKYYPPLFGFVKSKILLSIILIGYNVKVVVNMMA